MIPSVRRSLVGAIAGVASAAIVAALPSQAGLSPVALAILGALAGAAFAAALGTRPLGAGSALVWALGAAFVLWIGACAFASVAGTHAAHAMLDVARERLPLLASFVVASVPLGLAIGLGAPLSAPARRSFSPSRALVGGAFAGIVGGWAFGAWMEQVGFFPLVATIVRARSGAIGETVHFAIAIVVGVSFAALFQRDVRGLGSSLCWGVAYGVLWWFVGALTLLPLLTGTAVDYAPAHVATLYGSFVGHVVYGLIVGLLYAFVDGIWIWLFERSDPLAREAEGSGRIALASLGRGAIASVIGGLLFSVVMAATGSLGRVAQLVGSGSNATGFFVHLGISSLIGASYGLLFHDEATDDASALGWGATYGLIWWFVGALTLFPVLLHGPFVWTTQAAVAQFPSLVGHLVYGVALGLTFRYLERRERAATFVDERLRRRLLKRRRPPGTPAPAVWLFFVGVAVVVPILLG